MKIIDIDSLRPSAGRGARFQGIDHGASASCFVVTSAPGDGAKKHRHPYDEVFVILSGPIEVIVDGEVQMVDGGNIAIIPANSWHEFTNRSDRAALMVNIHPSPRMIQENWSQHEPSRLTEDQESDLPARIANPARRALRGEGILRLEQLTGLKEKEVMSLHGMGPRALGLLREALHARGLAFAPEETK